MPSVVGVMNKALLEIGQKPIAARTDNLESARAMDAVFDMTRDEVLRDHPWNAAKAMASLAASVTEPAGVWLYQYPLPSDCLRVLNLPEVGEPQEWEVQGRVLLTNDGTPVLIEYTKREEDPNIWDALLAEAISAKLAAAVAYRLTGSRNKETDAAAWYKDVLMRARMVDGLEEALVEPEEEDSWLSVRV